MEKKKKTLPVIGLRATEEEQEMFKKIRKARRIPSNSHVIRVLVTEECERIDGGAGNEKIKISDKTFF